MLQESMLETALQVSAKCVSCNKALLHTHRPGEGVRHTTIHVSKEEDQTICPRFCIKFFNE